MNACSKQHLQAGRTVVRVRLTGKRLSSLKGSETLVPAEYETHGWVVEWTGSSLHILKTERHEVGCENL